MSEMVQPVADHLIPGQTDIIAQLLWCMLLYLTVSCGFSSLRAPYSKSICVHYRIPGMKAPSNIAALLSGTSMGL